MKIKKGEEIIILYFVHNKISKSFQLSLKKKFKIKGEEIIIILYFVYNKI